MRKVPILLAVLTAVLLAAIATTGSQAKPQKAAVTTVTLTGWASSPAETDALKATIAGFERTHKSIDVEYAPINGDYPAAMLAKFSARKPPDVFYVDSNVAPDWMSQGVLAPLDSYIKKNKYNTKPDFARLLDAFRYKGKIYGFPKDWSPLGMEINLDLLQKAGAKAPTTWAQLRSVAQKLKPLMTGTAKPLCLDASWQRALAFVYQNKGNPFTKGKPTFTSAAVRSAMNFYVQLQKDGLGDTPAKLGAGWCGEAIGKEKAAIAFEGNWAFPYLPDTFPNVRWKFYPLPKGKQAATLAFTVSYSTSPASKNKQAAWVLITYLTGKTGMKLWTSKGLALPARADVKVNFPAPSRAPLLSEARYAHVWNWPAGWDKVWTVGNNELSAVLEGKESVDAMLSRLQSEAQSAK
jgi:multiple sugar transport system substrate-binding protein